MEGGYMNDPNEPRSNNKYDENQRERLGCKMVTCYMIEMATITNEEAIEYKGVIFSDICLCGYLTEYKQTEAKTMIRLWEQSGSYIINFFHKNESEETGLNKINFDGSSIPIRVYGTIKSYKRDKTIIGAKILQCDDNAVTSHKIRVMRDWLQLIGKDQNVRERKINEVNDFAKNIANNNNYYGGNNNNFSGNRQSDEERASKLLEEYRNRNGDAIGENEIKKYLGQNFNQKTVEKLIQIFTEQGFLYKNESNEYIIQIL